jgi:hypothetical protein
VSRPEGTSFDKLNADQGLWVGVKADGDGHLVLSDGTFAADPQVIGNEGKGEVVQTGGTNETGQIAIADKPGSVGSYDLKSGKIQLDSRPSGAIPDPAIEIGGAGQGSLNLGDANSTGAIYQVGHGAASVVVRGTSNGQGILQGWGPVHLKGTLVNSGQVVADGQGVDHALDLSTFAAVATAYENPRLNGTSGWFARRKGELKLPPVKVNAGTGTYTWGEDADDTMIDMVNSVRFQVNNARYGGDVAISLLSPLRGDIPDLPAGHKFIGVWSFDGSELGGFDSVDLQVRYDDAMASALGIDQDLLKLWEFDAARHAWVRLDHDPSFSRDPLNKLLAARVDGEFTYFAVSAPEPAGAVTLLAIGGAALTARRRRRHG